MLKFSLAVTYKSTYPHDCVKLSIFNKYLQNWRLIQDILCMIILVNQYTAISITILLSQKVNTFLMLAFSSWKDGPWAGGQSTIQKQDTWEIQMQFLSTSALLHFILCKAINLSFHQTIIHDCWGVGVCKWGHQLCFWGYKLPCWNMLGLREKKIMGWRKSR